MKKLTFALCTLALSATAFAAEHGFIAGLAHDELNESIFRVNVDKINGEEPSTGYFHHAHVGKNTVKVTLVFNPVWGENMDRTRGYIYAKDIDVNVEKGKTYYIGAKVNRSASQEAQVDGSFWEPVITEVH